MDEWFELLTTLFDKEELRDLAFALDVDHDNLPERKDSLARELLRQLQREGRMVDLATAVSDTRPHATIPDFLLQQAKMTVPAELRPYLEVVARRNGRLPLGPLDPTGREGGYFSLGQIFVNLTAGMNVKTSLHEVLFYDAALAYVYHHRHLILLGDPGSGKSTILRFLAHCLANHTLAPASGWLQLLNWQGVELPAATWKPETAVSSQATDQVRGAYLADVYKPEERNVYHWTADSPIPVFITLRDFARTDFDPQSPLALWQFVEQELTKDGLAQAIAPLRARALCDQIIFLLDGVDEVPIAQRADVWQAIDVLADGPYGGNRWLATCRILSFVDREAPAGVPVHTLKPLHPQQIEQFVAGWYGALAEAGELSRSEADQKTSSLQAAAQRQRLRPLAENPMLLTIMAIVQTYYGTLPNERAKLYQACVETLLLRWQRHKEEGDHELPDVLTQLDTSQANLERLLWEIAWQAHSQSDEREDAADIPEMDVVQIAKRHLGSYGKAEQFLEYTERRAHLLIGRGGEDERVFAFPHRTFQEYLAACHLASQRRFPREAAKLVAESVTWREVLNLAAGTLVFNQNNREKALDGVAEVMPDAVPDEADETGWFRVWLAAEMAVVVGREAMEQDEVGQEILPSLRQQLVALLEQGRLTPRQRAEAGDALGLLGDPRPGVCTLEPDMIPIAAGTFLMGEDKQETHVEAFAIARYPVTNAQFRFFVEDGGYTEKWQHCWSASGWHFRLQENWTEPSFSHDDFWTIENKPVVGVSWYEAEAYCCWLSEQTGQGYRLPTETEWERAARHTDGREYPWGDVWWDGIVNSHEAGIGRTTAVGLFPDGAAECGVQDISGNVFEWTTSLHLIGRSWRILRGGSWNNYQDSMRVVYRFDLHPDYRRNDHYGFRVARDHSP